jgi:hypothetical protein
MNPKILDLVPWDAVMPSGPQNILIALSYLMAALAIWFVAIEVKRRKDWVPVYAFIGGGLAVIYEPLGDMLVCALYPMHNQIGWIDMFGRSIPMFIGVLYFWYMSVPAIYFLRRLDSGLTKAGLWRCYALLIVLALGIEIYGVSQSAWVYYGSHAYVVFGVPLWAPFTYAGFTLSICVGLHLMSTQLDRKYHWLIVPGLPMFMVGGHLAVTLPASAAVFTTSDPFWLWFGATLTLALSIGMAWVMSMVYCNDSKRVAAGKMGEMHIRVAS